MPDNLYTTYKRDHKGLTGKQVLRISAPGRTKKGFIPLTRVCRQSSQGAALIYRTPLLVDLTDHFQPLILPNLPDLPNRSQEHRKNSSELGG